MPSCITTSRRASLTCPATGRATSGITCSSLGRGSRLRLARTPKQRTNPSRLDISPPPGAQHSRRLPLGAHNGSAPARLEVGYGIPSLLRHASANQLLLMTRLSSRGASRNASAALPQAVRKTAAASLSIFALRVRSACSWICEVKTFCVMPDDNARPGEL